MLIGYARVSTAEQGIDSQIDALNAAGCERILQDRVSGISDDRPGLTQALDIARAGDTLVVTRLDRLARSVDHLVRLAGRLAESGVQLRVLEQGIDTSTVAGRLLFHLLAAVAEFERDIIRERTAAGRQAARARGRTGGRPPKMSSEQIEAARELLTDESRTLESVAAIMGVHRRTLARAIPDHASLRQRPVYR